METGQDRGKILPFRPRRLTPEADPKVIKVKTTDELLDIMAKVSPSMRDPAIRERVRKMIDGSDPKSTP